MRMVIQRVKSASVSVEGRLVSKIGAGLLVLIGFAAGDTEAQIGPALEKLLNLRIFSDEQGRFMHSVTEVKGGVLLVSQFTLYADMSKGRRPSFSGALEPNAARELYDRALAALRTTHAGETGGGEFGAHMLVELENDGPVTIVWDDGEGELSSRAKSRDPDRHH